MKTNQSPADAHPFRCRADRQREIALDHHYHNLGNSDVVAALTPRRENRAEKPARTTVEPIDHDC